LAGADASEILSAEAWQNGRRSGKMIVLETIIEKELPSMSRICVLMTLLCALLVASALPGASAPQRAGAQTNVNLYLPLVGSKVISPLLRSPSQGVALQTLAPLLSFTPSVTGTHRIEVSASDTFSTTVFSTTLNIRDTSLQTITRPVNSNLDDSTRFFWRVGLIQGGSSFFSEARTFETPDKSATALPPKPVLEAPQEGATLPAGRVTLRWQPVPEALYYRVTVDRADGSEFESALLDGAATTLELPDVPAGQSLNWKAKALTATGWSVFAGPVNFTTQ
jgi:hypothetical protein